MSSTLRVLAYHRVGDPAGRRDLDPSMVSATAGEFERQVRHLARRYSVVGLDRVVDALLEDRPLPSRPVLITFDDAYRDFRDVAWPILRRYDLPATLFVPTAYASRPERRFWWDRLYAAVSGAPPGEAREALDRLPPGGAAGTVEEAYGRARRELKELPHAAAMAAVDRLCRELGETREEEEAVLGWDGLQALAEEDGLTIGSHTREHPLLTRVSHEEARREIAGSRREIAARIGREPVAFAYPGGYHDRRVTELVRGAGYRLAFTMVDGHNRIPGADRFRLRRTGITRRTSLPLFALRLQPWFGAVDRWRHRGECARQVG